MTTLEIQYELQQGWLGPPQLEHSGEGQMPIPPQAAPSLHAPPVQTSGQQAPPALPQASHVAADADFALVKTEVVKSRLNVMRRSFFILN